MLIMTCQTYAFAIFLHAAMVSEFQVEFTIKRHRDDYLVCLVGEHEMLVQERIISYAQGMRSSRRLLGNR